MKKLIVLFLGYSFSLHCMQSPLRRPLQDSETEIQQETFKKWYKNAHVELEHMNINDETYKLSQNMTSHLEATTRKCALLLKNAEKDRTSHEKFALTLKELGMYAKEAPEFCDYWEQVKWDLLTLAKSEHFLAKISIKLLLQKVSLNTMEGEEKKGYLLRATENRLRLKEFNQKCKSYCSKKTEQEIITL